MPMTKSAGHRRRAPRAPIPIAINCVSRYFAQSPVGRLRKAPTTTTPLRARRKSRLAGTSGTDRGNLGVVEALKSHPLPEAPASANVFVTLKGRQVQLTLRDTDERRLLQRLAVVLDQFPLEPKAQASTTPAPPQPPTCKWHGGMKESIKAPGTWYCPSKMGDGSYCQERWPAKGR